MELKTAIQKLRDSKELHVVNNEIDWKFQVGSICRKHFREPILFSNIKGYNDFKIFTGGFSSEKTISILLGIEKYTSLKEISCIVKKRLLNKIKPKIVNGTSSDNGFLNCSSVDLHSLPIPWWDRRDSGRYIGTWHANITKDIQNLTRNVGVYRMMVLDETHSTISVSKHSHLAQHFLKSEAMGRDLDMVTAIGTEEEIVMAAAAAVPIECDEFESAGAISCEPVILGRCMTISLEYPINSEIILEGKLKAGIRVTDGPFADYTGTTSCNKNALLYEVSAMYYKNNPVFRGMAVGMPGAEDHQMLSILASIGMMHFHGSKYRNIIQSFLLRCRLFKLFQLSGKILNKNL
jgi:4-hydroxy-3-polyprenylbenzoate decarboxylase